MSVMIKYLFRFFFLTLTDVEKLQFFFCIVNILDNTLQSALNGPQIPIFIKFIDMSDTSMYKRNQKLKFIAFFCFCFDIVN